MNEKIVIKSERGSFGTVAIVIFAVVFVFSLLAFPSSFGAVFAFTLVGGGALVGFAYLWIANTEITVTDKRVYGKTVFGKRVDLPVDSISAIGTSWLKGLAVATASGKISFMLLKNRDEIHSCVSQLLIERQQKRTSAVKQEVPQSSADELKKYKDLLEGGVISQDEFDAKKKQLLGV